MGREWNMLSGREQKNIRVGRKGPDQLHTQMHISCAETPTIGLCSQREGCRVLPV